jgi:hypothetical protein
MPPERVGKTAPRRDVPYRDSALGPARHQYAAAIRHECSGYRMDRTPVAGELVSDPHPGYRVVELNQAIVAADNQKVAHPCWHRRDCLHSRWLIDRARQQLSQAHLPQADRPVLPAGGEKRPAVTKLHEHPSKHPTAMPGQY